MSVVHEAVLMSYPVNSEPFTVQDESLYKHKVSGIKMYNLSTLLGDIEKSHD